ncbi:MAG: DUF1343 domain-containing protein [Opitutaceae bacterium]|nr:DUF1343 domain-containing protein [Opitutaceae bacterium]
MRLQSSVTRAFALQLTLLAALLLAACGTTGSRPVRRPAKPAAPAETQPTPPPADEGLMLGIDVLERQDFAALRGKRVGLLTHPAAVNRFGTSTLEVIQRDKRNKLVALYAGEHGIYGTVPAGEKFEDHVDPASGLKVFSLYTGRSRKPTAAQLAGIDVLVIDLQDIGTRSYTFVGSMRLAVEACFESGKEVVLLDRPNPLGGLKVSGPPLDAQWINFLAPIQMPYVHGLTMGEIARMAQSEPGMLQVPDDVRRRGKLTVIAMRGWKRSMRWTDTGLAWVPTSPNVGTFEAVAGYPMTGLGSQIGGFRHGIGTPLPFRLLTHPAIPQAQLLAELNGRKIPGLRFSPRDVTVPAPPKAKDQAPRLVQGVYVEILDWAAWRPTELGLHMMQIAAAASPKKNPFAAATTDEADLFNKHFGSNTLWAALRRDGARLDVKGIFADWERQAQAFQKRSSKYWLYR